MAEMAARPHVRPTGAQRAARSALLFDRARSGDQQAFKELVRALTPMLWHVARTAGLDRDDAADAVQTAWLTLHRSMQQVRDPTALAGWLITVTQREARRLRRAVEQAGQVRPDDDLLELPDRDRGPDQRVLDEERRRCVWDNLRRLSPRCQHLMRIVAFAERPDYATVASALGMPRGSIGPTRGRCLEKLRALIIDDSRWST